MSVLYFHSLGGVAIPSIINVIRDNEISLTPLALRFVVSFCIQFRLVINHC